MAVRRILKMGHPNLRRRAPDYPVELLGSAEFERLQQDLRDTLHDYGGVGLAAPQIDVNWRVAIIEMGARTSRYGDLKPIPLTTFINPVIDVVESAPRAGFWEGCLSVPGLRGYVERPQEVNVRYTDTNGNPQQLNLRDFHATVVQHEFDHLDGTLYVDRIKDPALLMFEDQLDRHRDHWLEHPLLGEP